MQRKKKITPEDFLQKVMNQYGQINAAKAAIERLERDYRNEYCKATVGQIFNLPEKVDGYDRFTVERIDVEYKPGERSKQIDISFRIYGAFSGPDVETKKGFLNPPTDENERKAIA